MAKLSSLHSTILRKKEILEQARITLKQEFIGIDKVIDEVIDSVSSWFLFPDLQTKPVVINLWGLTGVGKSSLVRRVAELIDFKEKYFSFDLGVNKTESGSLKYKFRGIFKNDNGIPVIIAFDEFQLARSKDEEGKELDNTAWRLVWELIDSGKFQWLDYDHRIENLHHLYHTLMYWEAQGIEVQNGLVLSRKKEFIEDMDDKSQYRERFRNGCRTIDYKRVLFVPKSSYSSICDFSGGQLSGAFEVSKRLMEMDAIETIEFLKEILKNALSPKIVDCSKGLIFILGNIDEAYTMSDDFNPDISADEFHEISLKINLPDIKKALRKRFRSEQIARLGNLHIIYPAFNSDSFRKIIQLELATITQRILHSHKMKLEFDESICELIYKEGVYPTQGTRPIFTTIHYIVNTKLGKLFSELIIHKLVPEKIIFKANEEQVILELIKKGKVIHIISEKQVLNLERLRKNRKDDVQSITAVHESGHAVIEMVLMKSIPEVMYSVTADADSHGFVYIKRKWKYIAKNELIPRLAVFLGGIAAERMVFGDARITVGGREDIQQATEFITTMLKDYGMGNVPAFYRARHFQNAHTIHEDTLEVNSVAEKMIQDAVILAEKTLSENKELHLRLSDFLADNRFMSKEQIKEMLVKYGTQQVNAQIIEDGDFLFYRKHLKKQVEELQSRNIGSGIKNIANIPVTLNREENGIEN